MTIITGAQTTEVTGDGERVNGLIYKDRQSGALHTVELAGVFVQIGLRAEYGLAEGHGQALAATAKSRSMRAARPRCPAYSPPEIAP